MTLATTGKSADTSAPLHPLLAERWSPRGFDRRHRLDDEQLSTVLEAARWAPSANNSQPWRFLVTRRGDDDFDRITSLLSTGNLGWAAHASALILVAAQTTDETAYLRQSPELITARIVKALATQTARATDDADARASDRSVAE
jgi:nitroreductase